MTPKELRKRYSFEELKKALSPDNLHDKHMDIADALKKLVEGTIDDKNNDSFWKKILEFHAAYTEYTPGVRNPNEAKRKYEELYISLFEEGFFAERLYTLYNLFPYFKPRPDGVRDHITYISDPEWDIPDEIETAKKESEEEGYELKIRRGKR